MFLHLPLLQVSCVFSAAILCQNVSPPRCHVTYALAHYWLRCAVDGGKEDSELVFNETSWGDPQRAKPYPKSKMLAEKEAWTLHAEHVKGGGATQLCTVHPGAVFGPQITTSGHASADIMKQIVNKEMPMVPDAGIGLVDARDVARIHVAAMTHPDADGKRFMACESTKSFLDMAAAV